MVHGGGHHHGGGQSHHHHSGGIGWGGGGRRHHHQHHQQQQQSNNNNIFVVNRNPLWNSGTAAFWAPAPVHHRRERVAVYDHDRDECDKCCEVCSLALCTFCCCRCRRCCCCWNHAAIRDPSAENQSRMPQEKASRENTNGKLFCPCFFLSLIVFILLLVVSSYEARWTLNAGESRQIIKPIFNDKILVSSPDSRNIQVYEISGGKCPPLTGPIVTLEDEQPISLSADDYQYDYFFLNTGSTISLDVSQRKGSTNVYLLRGEKTLQRLEGNSDAENDSDFSAGALITRFSSQGGYANVSLKYTAKKPDTYILVYDNASTAPGELSIHYRVQLTTFDLQGKSPICNDLDEPCSVDFSNRKSCIIIQSLGHPGPPSDHLGPPSDHRESSSHVQDTVLVDINGHRRWQLILFCTSVPFLIAVFHFLLLQWCRRSGSSSYEPVSRAEEEERPPPTAPHAISGPHEEDRPPPTAPQTATPSAPLEAQPVHDDYGSIVVVPAENVIPIPPPTVKN